MNKVSLIATKSLRHGRKMLSAGDSFEANRETAATYVAVGVAKHGLPKVIPTPAVPVKKVFEKKQTYMRRDMVAALPKDEPAKVEQPKAEATKAEVPKASTAVGAIDTTSAIAKMPTKDTAE